MLICLTNKRVTLQRDLLHEFRLKSDYVRMYGSMEVVSHRNSRLSVIKLLKSISVLFSFKKLDLGNINSIIIVYRRISNGGDREPL